MQKKTEEVIVASGNDYVIQVKGNHKGLLSIIKERIRNSDPIDVDYIKEINRGREENRSLFLYHFPKEKRHKDWPSSEHIIKLNNFGTRGSKSYYKIHYYITSKKEISAEYYTSKIRSHWGIENRLHWVKDAILNEDKGRVKGMDLSGTISTIRHAVINIFRANNIKSIKTGIEKYANKLYESQLLIN